MYCRNLWLLAFASLAVAAPALSAQPGDDPPAGRHGWLGSLEAGKAEAKRTGKPLMVVLRCVP
jgi:hypothetical protein